MTSKYFQRTIATVSAVMIFAGLASAQDGSTRPRRVNAPSNVSRAQGSNNAPAVSDDSAQGDTASGTNANTPRANTSAPGRSGSGSGSAAGSADTSRAYSLLQQKQYAAAAKEAKQVAAKDPNNSEAWKIAGFAEFNLKQYAEATADLQRALDLQRAAKQEDANTIDALAQSYVLTEKFDNALPLLVTATTRKGATPDATMLYYRGIAEYRTGKAADAERSFNAAVKANPKDAASLYYLGQLAYARNDLDAAVSALNRATQNDARLAQAWTLLTSAYLRRAARAEGPKANADYLNAVRAGESLTRVKTDADAAMLYGQALIGAQQYTKAATVLERATAGDQAKGPALYLLGYAYTRAENFPKAIAALERAAALTPDDVNIYRQLGYAYEVSKQYAKALAAYQKGAALAPADTNFKESIERVQPFAK